MNKDYVIEKQSANGDEKALILKARSDMDGQIATEEQLYLLVTRGYSKRAMEQFFAIDQVNQEFQSNADKIKGLGYSHFLTNVKISISEEEKKDRDKLYKQEVDNLVKSAILVSERRQTSFPVKLVTSTAPFPKTKVIQKQKTKEGWKIR